MTATWTGIIVDLAYADLDRKDGDLAGAEARLKDVFDAISEPGRMPPQVSAVALLGRARVALARGRHGDATEAVREAAAWALDGRDMPALSRVADVAADIAARDGDPGGAATLLGASATLRGAPEEGDPDVVALRAELRSTLGAGYMPAYAAGLALSRETVIARLTAGAPAVSGR
jgi:ATP/maltotriose-dependent transcriptional regulator MalT